MVPNLLFYQLRLVTLVLLCLIIHAWWPDEPSPTPQTPLKSDKPRRKRSKAPKPFTGLIQKPICDVCEQSVDARLMAPRLATSSHPLHPRMSAHRRHPSSLLPGAK